MVKKGRSFFTTLITTLKRQDQIVKNIPIILKPLQVMGVLLVILSSVDNAGDVEEHKTQRHFNRAMAMRSLRGVALPGSRGRKKGGS